MKCILKDQGELWLDKSFLRSHEEYFSRVNQTTNWKQEFIKLFGKVYPTPRLQAWYGDEECVYTYSGLSLSPLPWSSELLKIKKKVEKMANSHFNSVLVQLYRDGQDSNDWHADDEKELGKNPVIASLSLGESRDFQLRKKDKSRTESIDLVPGSLLIMKGPLQEHWKHQIPKRSNISSPRINLTFRLIKK